MTSEPAALQNKSPISTAAQSKQLNLERNLQKQTWRRQKDSEADPSQLLGRTRSLAEDKRVRPDGGRAHGAALLRLLCEP